MTQSATKPSAAKMESSLWLACFFQGFKNFFAYFIKSGQFFNLGEFMYLAQLRELVDDIRTTLKNLLDSWEFVKRKDQKR